MTESILAILFIFQQPKQTASPKDPKIQQLEFARQQLQREVTNIIKVSYSPKKWLKYWFNKYVLYISLSLADGLCKDHLK